MNNIFISGTFTDLNEIRSFITHTIGSELNKRLYSKYGEIYRFTDLRIGVENVQDSEQTITTCLRRLRDAAPPHPFVVILGNRYGWCPSEAERQGAAHRLQDSCLRAALTQGEQGRSITEMEIDYGAFGLGQDTPEAYRARTVFVFPTEDAEDSPRLRALKQRIRETFPPQQILCPMHRTDNPCGDADFKQALLDRLWAIADAAFHQKYGDQPTKEHRERTIHENFRDLKAAGFYGRLALVQNISRTFFNPRCDITYIHGPTGAGKSSLISKIVKETAVETFPLYCGLTKNSDSAQELIRMICARLQDALPDREYACDDLVDRYRLLCRAYDEDENTPQLLIAIDAIDQLRPDDYAQKLAFLPLDKNGYQKLHFLVSGTDDGDATALRWQGFAETAASFVSIAVGNIRQSECTEMCQSIFSQELGIGDVADEVIAYLDKKPFCTPLHLKIALLRLALLSEREVICTQAAGSDAKKRAAAFIRPLRSFIVSERRLVPMDRLSVALLRIACDRIDPRLFKLCQYIALSRHGLPLSVIGRLYGDDFDETRFWQLYYRLENIFFEHSDGCIDFTHKCFRNALRDELGKSEREHDHRQILDALHTAEDCPDIQAAEIPYHAVEAATLPYLYTYITANYPKATDARAVRERKIHCLQAAANTLRGVNPYRLFSHEDNEHLTIAFSRFCVNVLTKAYSCSLTDTNNCLTMLTQLIDTYPNIYDDYRFFAYADASDDFIEHYHRMPSVTTTLKAFSETRSPLLYFFEALQAVNQYLSFAHQQREQFRFIEEYGWNDHDKVTILQRFLDCAQAYEHFHYAYNWYYLIRELQQKKDIKIERLDAFFCSFYDIYRSPHHTAASTEDAAEDKDSRLIQHIIDQGYQALEAMANLTLDLEEETPALSAEEIEHTIRALRAKVKMREGNYAQELVAFLCQHLPRYSELEQDKAAILKLCGEAVGFLRQYMDFYGFHLGAFHTIRECLKIIENCYAQNNPNKISKVNALYHELAEFFIRFYSAPARLGRNELNTAREVQLFFTDFEKRLQDPAMYPHLNERIRGYKKLCLFLETRLAVTQSTALHSDHLHAFRDMTTTFNHTARFFAEHQPQGKTAHKLTRTFLKAVDAYIRIFETKKLVGTQKSLIQWLIDENHFPYLANNEIFPLLKDNMLSLLEYEKGFRFMGYTNEEGKYVWDTWEWKPIHRGVIK